jgi:uncharacterized phage protein (TIGR02218 family)
LVINWQTDPTGGNWAKLGNGVCTVTGGVAEGQQRTVQYAVATGMAFCYPLYEIPAAGDTFTVSYGCDKTQATCGARFANAQNYRGFPFVPPAESAVAA